MVSWRARESKKQARCREDNESAAPAARGASSFRCECGDRKCTSAITLTGREYEAVRAHSTHFAIARNHENPDSEQVIDENERFAIVATVTGDETKLARRSDPRQRRRERRWRKAAGSETARTGR